MRGGLEGVCVCVCAGPACPQSRFPADITDGWAESQSVMRTQRSLLSLSLSFFLRNSFI